MSHQAYSWVLQHGPRLDDVDRHGTPYGPRARGFRAVLSSIANAANADGRNAHPGQKAISEESLYSSGQVTTIVNELLAEGWLEIEEQGGGRGRATVYRLDLRRRDTAQSPGGIDGRNRPISDDKPRSPEPETAQFSEETAQSKRPDQRERARQRSTNEKTNEKTNGRGGEPATRSSPSLFADRFDEFWERYPHKAAKPHARKMWERNVDSPDAVLAGLERWCAYWLGAEVERKYIPHPGTWLNRHGWNDDPPFLPKPPGHVSYDPPPVKII